MQNEWHRLLLCCVSGLIPSDKNSASYLLRRKGGGNAVVIAVGGAPEALDAHPGAYCVLLANKKGFIKLAMEHGYENSSSWCTAVYDLSE